MEQVYRSLYAAFPDFHWDLQVLLAEDEWVSAKILMTGTHLGTPDLPVFGGLMHTARPTGKPVSVLNIHVYRMSSGLISISMSLNSSAVNATLTGLTQATPTPAVIALSTKERTSASDSDHRLWGSGGRSEVQAAA